MTVGCFFPFLLSFSVEANRQRSCEDEHPARKTNDVGL
jgi:hypothetical protein